MAYDSHRAEVRKRVYSFFFEDYKLIPQNPTAKTDAIMALLDAERERWIGEVKSALPEKEYMHHIWEGGKNPDEARRINKEITAIRDNVLDAVSKVLDEL